MKLEELSERERCDRLEDVEKKLQAVSKEYLAAISLARKQRVEARPQALKWAKLN